MYSIRDIEKITGLTASTLRYYEKEGILPTIERDNINRRRYSDDELEWIKLVIALRDTGMSMEMIKEYIQLLYNGDDTLNKRRELLLEHKKKVEKEISLTLAHLEKINRKIAIYELLVSGKTKDDILI